MQFVKIYSTFPDGGNNDLEGRINATLRNNPRSRIVQAFPCPIEKIGGTEAYLMIVFEREEDQQ